MPFIDRHELETLRRHPQEAYEEAYEQGRHEALRAVIRALDLKEYQSPQLFGEPALETDRFWKDINTALDVREERKRQETREKTEQKIAGLAKEQQVARFTVSSEGIRFAAGSISADDLFVSPKKPAKPTAKGKGGNK